MSGISRRSLLGYSGTAAAGAALGTAGAAQAADTTGTGAAAANAAQGTQAATTFPPGTQFKGRAATTGGEGELAITFSVAVMDAPASNGVAPIDIANALTELAEARGWAPITFYGTPAPAPLTP
ncbi:hypothetical protein [Streptomyces sp. NPDC002054]|uniref:hypothetical protein n=1 Tax=Streptomyces sp. NPDC002054 TaxID=3154663 RepID=UPI0033300EAA